MIPSSLKSLLGSASMLSYLACAGFLAGFCVGQDPWCLLGAFLGLAWGDLASRRAENLAIS